MISKQEILDFRTPQNAIFTYSPVVFSVPERQVLLQIKVSAPVKGDNLPIIILSHGHGQSNHLSSFRGYGPLADFYASQGFVVIQPTHQNSKVLNLDPDNPEGGLFWLSRAKDIKYILDHLDEIETIVPELSNRIDKNKIAAVGHSLGGHTIGMLAGMQVTNPVNGEKINMLDERIKASVLIGIPGDGADVAAPAGGKFPVLKNNSFTEMTSPALIVYGDEDFSPIFSERKNWRSDAYTMSSGPKSLLTIFGAQHIFGGISGYDSNETIKENPETVADVQRFTLAYILSSLYPENNSWQEIQKEVEADENPTVSIESKGY